jgi:hypothetical protein
MKIMRFLLLGLALGITSIASASAGTLHRFGAPAADQDRPMVAGEVSSDGRILAGTGFTVTRTGPGAYYIQFPNGYFAPSGCASMVVESSSAKPLSSDVKGLCQPHPYFRVIFFNAAAQTQDAEFHFIVLKY